MYVVSFGGGVLGVIGFAKVIGSRSSKRVPEAHEDIDITSGVDSLNSLNSFVKLNQGLHILLVKISKLPIPHSASTWPITTGITEPITGFFITGDFLLPNRAKNRYRSCVSGSVFTESSVIRFRNDIPGWNIRLIWFVSRMTCYSDLFLCSISGLSVWGIKKFELWRTGYLGN